MSTNTRKYKQTAQKLKNKYSRESKINEQKLCGEESVAKKSIRIVLSIFVLLLVMICALLCISALLNSIHNTPNQLFGVFSIQSSSDVMSKEEIEIDNNTYPSGISNGDKLTFHKVNPRSLQKGDIIAFYTYTPSITVANTLQKSEVAPALPTQQLITPLPAFWGFSSSTVYTAAKNGATLNIRHVTKLLADESGKWWFQTQASQNASPDLWFIDEDYILGVNVPTTQYSTALGIVSFVYSVGGLIIIMLIPIAVIAGMCVQSDIYKKQLKTLELDVIEQKRKLTDKICVINKIGFRMDEPTKLKVLSQAQKSEMNTYISLLWRDGKKPQKAIEYAHKNKLKLYPTRKLCALNNECETRYQNGEDIDEISKHYLDTKTQIYEQKKNIKQKRKLAKSIVKSSKAKS